MPGVVALIPLGLEPFVVFLRAVRVVGAVRPLGQHAVVAFEDVEAAFADPRADQAVGFQPQPGHPLLVRAHMGLADQVAAHARLAQVVAHGHLAHL